MHELTGGCHCGAVRYRAEGKMLHHALCHCTDCRRSAGAPMVGWIAFAADAVRVTQGNVTRYNSSGDAWREFCGTCGTGLFYRNETMLPGIVDIQSATLDDPDAVPPQAHIQVAERLDYATRLDTLPAFDRFPGP